MYAIKNTHQAFDRVERTKEGFGIRNRGRARWRTRSPGRRRVPVLHGWCAWPPPAACSHRPHKLGRADRSACRTRAIGRRSPGGKHADTADAG